MLRFGALIVALSLILGAVACGGGGGKGASTAKPATPATPATPASTTAADATAAPLLTLEAVASGTPVPPGELRLTSSAFDDGEPIPADYTCDGEDVIPPLTISGAPDSVVSFALTVTDIDVAGGGFVHWVVWDIPPTSTDTPRGTVPFAGQEALTSRNTPGYFGPCPTSGVHHYVFDLYALDTGITIDTLKNGKAELLRDIQGHIIAQTKLTGTYERANSAAPTVP